MALTPRQDGPSGRVRDLVLSLSPDGQTWTEVLRSRLPDRADRQVLPLPRPTPARFLRLTVLGSQAREDHASLAEVAVHLAK